MGRKEEIGEIIFFTFQSSNICEGERDCYTPFELQRLFQKRNSDLVLPMPVILLEN